VLLAVVVTGGCNNSRYGMTYDERLPQIKRVAVLPAGVEVYSLHTGGMLERRADLEPGVAESVARLVADVVRERRAEPVIVPRPELKADAEGGAASPKLALLDAIRESIVTHHYLVGKEVVFEYPAGDAPQVLCSQDAEAVLCVYVKSVVATAGRKALRTTAKVVGYVTGVHVSVSTDETVVALVLVDRKTGEVLWFNQAARKKVDAQKEKKFKALVKDCGQFLLKPREKGGRS
jgi:hypothetical protein